MVSARLLAGRERWKVGPGQLHFLSVLHDDARGAIRAVVLIQFGSEVRLLLHFLTETLEIELGVADFGPHQDD